MQISVNHLGPVYAKILKKRKSPNIYSVFSTATDTMADIYTIPANPRQIEAIIIIRLFASLESKVLKFFQVEEVDLFFGT